MLSPWFESEMACWPPIENFSGLDAAIFPLLQPYQLSLKLIKLFNSSTNGSLMPGWFDTGFEGKRIKIAVYWAVFQVLVVSKWEIVGWNLGSSDLHNLATNISWPVLGFNWNTTLVWTFLDFSVQRQYCNSHWWIYWQPAQGTRLCVVLRLWSRISAGMPWQGLTQSVASSHHCTDLTN